MDERTEEIVKASAQALGLILTAAIPGGAVNPLIISGAVSGILAVASAWGMPEDEISAAFAVGIENFLALGDATKLDPETGNAI